MSLWDLDATSEIVENRDNEYFEAYQQGLP